MVVLLGVGDAEAVILVLSRSLEDHQLDVLVVFHRPVDELHLEPRLALEVQHFLFAVADLDERVALVVGGDLLAFLRRDLESKQPRARRGAIRPWTAAIA